MKQIFVSDIEKGLADCESIEKYNDRILQFFEYPSLANDAKPFVKYFEKYKEDIIKYHVMKGAGRGCELSENKDLK